MANMDEVHRTERGWAGHYILARYCLFRRNTLLTCGARSIVVSTVGGRFENNEVKEIGKGILFETRAFNAVWDGTYWEADINNEVRFDSKWYTNECDDRLAQTMHEEVVDEITDKMRRGELS